MKILEITTVRSGSTGRNALDLKSFITKNGGEYIIAFSEPDTMPLNGDILIGNKLDHKIHAFLSRLFGLQGYFSYISTKRFLRKVKSYKPDVVQLGNLHSNYINLPLLFDFLKEEGIPVVMVLHDCWFFTGKCTHFTSLGCNKWMTQCSKCPSLKNDNISWFFDFTSKIFNDRQSCYSSLDSLYVVAVSDWEKKIAEQSPLFKNANVCRIYNWIDTSVFTPSSEERHNTIRQKYNLNTSYKYLISVGAWWSSSSSKTHDAIRLVSLLPSNVRLIIVGRSEENIFPDSIIRIPYTSDCNELAVLYSLATAYIHFSVEDTFGKVIAEAMSCQVVPIVFDSTACGEIAGNYGIVVPSHNVDDIIDSISLADDIDRRIAVRDYAIRNYSPEISLAYYYDLYKLITADEKN